MIIIMIIMMLHYHNAGADDANGGCSSLDSHTFPSTVCNYRESAGKIREKLETEVQQVARVGNNKTQPQPRCK